MISNPDPRLIDKKGASKFIAVQAGGGRRLSSGPDSSNILYCIIKWRTGHVVRRCGIIECFHPRRQVTLSMFESYPWGGPFDRSL